MGDGEHQPDQKLQSSDGQHDEGRWFHLVRVGYDVIYTRVIKDTRVAGETSGTGRLSVELIHEKLTKLRAAWKREWDVPILIELYQWSMTE